MEKYVRPEAEVIEFASVDVVTTSGGEAVTECYQGYGFDHTTNGDC